MYPLWLLRDFSKNIQRSVYFTIIADECADITKEEQLATCFRWVDENLEVHEGFVGFHGLGGTKADEIVKIIFHTIQRMDLKTENARGQCYDGTSTMAGVKNALQQK